MLSGKTKVHTTIGKGIALWHIVVSVTNGVETIVTEFDNVEKASLACLQDLVAQELTELTKELSPITNGGFTIYQRRK